MKRLVLLLFSCFLAFNVHSQDIYFQSRKFESGTNYALCTSPVSSNIQKDKAQILKFVFPKWEEKLDTLFEFSPYKNPVKVKEATLTIKFGEVTGRCLNTRNSENCLRIAIVEVPAEYSNRFIEENDNFKIIKTYQLIRPASIELVDAESVKIEPEFVKLGVEESDITYFKDNKNDIIYVKLKSGASWGDWQEYYCGGCGGGYSMKSVCLALKEVGYYAGPEVYKMNPSLKDALTRFQKDNGLPIGSLDYETLKVLSDPSPAVWSEEEKLMYSLNDEEPPKYRRR